MRSFALATLFSISLALSLTSVVFIPNAFSQESLDTIRLKLETKRDQEPIRNLWSMGFHDVSTELHDLDELYTQNPDISLEQVLELYSLALEVKIPEYHHERTLRRKNSMERMAPALESLNPEQARSLMRQLSEALEGVNQVASDDLSALSLFAQRKFFHEGEPNWLFVAGASQLSRFEMPAMSEAEDLIRRFTEIKAAQLAMLPLDHPERAPEKSKINEQMMESAQIWLHEIQNQDYAGEMIKENLRKQNRLPDSIKQ